MACRCRRGPGCFKIHAFIELAQNLFGMGGAQLSDGGVMIRVSAFRRTDTSMVLNDSVCAAFSSIRQIRDERTERSLVLGPGYWVCVLVGEGLGHRGG